MASLPLPSSHSNRPANPHPDAPSQSLPCCCCARPDCAVVRQNQSALDRLESDLETAARLGQVCSFFFLLSFLVRSISLYRFLHTILILPLPSCIPVLVLFPPSIPCPSYLATVIQDLFTHLVLLLLSLCLSLEPVHASLDTTAGLCPCCITMNSPGFQSPVLSQVFPVCHGHHHQ